MAQACGPLVVDAERSRRPHNRPFSEGRRRGNITTRSPCVQKRGLQSNTSEHRSPPFSHVEEVEEPLGGVELEELALVECGLAERKEGADRRSARQQHLRVEAEQESPAKGGGAVKPSIQTPGKCLGTHRSRKGENTGGPRPLQQRKTRQCKVG